MSATQILSPRRLLTEAFSAGLEAVDPALEVSRSLHRSGSLVSLGSNVIDIEGSVRLVELGNAAHGMTVGALSVVGDLVVEGVAVGLVHVNATVRSSAADPIYKLLRGRFPRAVGDAVAPRPLPSARRIYAPAEEHQSHTAPNGRDGPFRRECARLAPLSAHAGDTRLSKRSMNDHTTRTRHR